MQHETAHSAQGHLVWVVTGLEETVAARVETRAAVDAAAERLRTVQRLSKAGLGEGHHAKNGRRVCPPTRLEP